MSAVVAIDLRELLALARLLGRCADDSDREHLVMELHSYEALNDDEAELLISGLMLEAT